MTELPWNIGSHGKSVSMQAIYETTDNRMRRLNYKNETDQEAELLIELTAGPPFGFDLPKNSSTPTELPPEARPSVAEGAIKQVEFNWPAAREVSKRPKGK